MASLIERNGIYYITDRLSGKIVRHSLRTDSYQIAKEKLRQYQSAQLRGQDNPLPTHTPIAQVVNAYVEKIRAFKTAKSAQTDVYYLRDAFGPICEALQVTSRKPSPLAKKRPPKEGQDRRRRALVSPDAFRHVRFRPFRGAAGGLDDAQRGVYWRVELAQLAASKYAWPMSAAFDIIRRMARKPRADLPDEPPAWRLMRLSKAAKQNDPRLVELVKACRKGDVAEVRRLLKSGLSPNQIAPGDAALDTAVTAAVYARQAHVVRVLAQAKADFDTTPSSYTPLVTASGWRDLAMVHALIDGGANVNQPDQAGVTPLHAAVRGGPGQTPLPDSDPLPVVDALLKAGADPDFVPPRQTSHPAVMTPSRWAAYEGSRQMIDLFVAAGSKEKKLDALRLCGAAHRGTLDELKELVDRGVNVNQRDATHTTPLVAASEAGHERVVAYLLKRGADPNLHAGYRNDGQSALIAAAVYGRLKIVKMLVRAGADHAYKMRVAPNRRIRFGALDFARHAESEHRREGADAKKLRSVVLFLESLRRGN